MAVGRQTDPGRVARRGGSPPLHHFVCTSCWHRPLECTCEGTERTADGRQVTNRNWHRVPVFTTGDIAAAVERVTGITDLGREVVEQLRGEREVRRPTRRAAERSGARQEGGRVVA